MGRPLRFVPSGHVVEVTCRTIHGRFLLRPSDELNQVVVGALGRAQRRYGLTIHGLVVMSNHYHALCAPRDAKQLAQVMRLANSKIAREVGKLHDWEEKVWGRRYSSSVLTQEEDVHVHRLRYLLSHGVKEGLVERVLDWPGVHCASALLAGKPLRGLWFDRTKQSRAEKKGRVVDPLDFATPEEIELTPLPTWKHLSQEEICERVKELIKDIEQDATVKRTQGELPPVLGRKRIKKQRPHHRPQKLKKSPIPAFHGKQKALLQALQDAYRAFLAAYLVAAEELRRGKTDVQFPEGSFPPPQPFVRGSPLFEPG